MGGEFSGLPLFVQVGAEARRAHALQVGGTDSPRSREGRRRRRRGFSADERASARDVPLQTAFPRGKGAPGSWWPRSLGPLSSLALSRPCQRVEHPEGDREGQTGAWARAPTACWEEPWSPPNSFLHEQTHR